MRAINFIVLHCTAGSQSQTLQSIRTHWQRLGWRRPGYHRLIAADGTVHKLAEYSEVTNGVAGHNANSIHISYIGGVVDGRPTDNRTRAQLNAMQKLVEESAKLFPTAAIVGHRDFSPDKNRDGIITADEWIKACPSFSVKEWLDLIGFKAKGKRFARTVSVANMRSGPGTSHATVSAPLPTGALVEVLANAGEWQLVKIRNSTGWIFSQLLTEQI